MIARALGVDGSQDLRGADSVALRLPGTRSVATQGAAASDSNEAARSRSPPMMARAHAGHHGGQPERREHQPRQSPVSVIALYLADGLGKENRGIPPSVTDRGAPGTCTGSHSPCSSCERRLGSTMRDETKPRAMTAPQR